MRHPRGYDGNGVTSKTLDSLLLGAMQRLDRQRARDPQAVLAAWPEIVGEQIASFTVAKSFESRTLFVTVSNSTVYSMLSGSEKKHLLAELQSRLPGSGVRNIVFRLG